LGIAYETKSVAQIGPARVVSLSGTITIDSDWGGGYCATLHLTNTDSVASNTWTATVDLKGATLSNAWNATSSVSGAIMTLTSVDFNGTIQPGNGIEPPSSSPGFCASGTQRPTLVSVVGSATNCGTYYLDNDHYGYGNPASSLYTCSPPANYVAVGGDCCDSDNLAHPGQTSYFQTPSRCSSYDYDCSGSNDRKSNGATGCFETPFRCMLNASRTGCNAVPTAPLPAACNGGFTSYDTAQCGQTWFVSTKGCAFYVTPAGPGCTSWSNGGPGGQQFCK
jgi:hypothetical protein